MLSFWSNRILLNVNNVLTIYTCYCTKVVHFNSNRFYRGRVNSNNCYSVIINNNIPYTIKYRLPVQYSYFVT